MRLIKVMFGLLLTLALLAACSEDNESDAGEVNDANDSIEEVIEEEENVEEDELEAKLEQMDDQEELSLGDTAYVYQEYNDLEYEFTPHSVQFVDEFDNKSPSGEVHALIETTIKNLGDEPMDVKEVSRPAFGEDEEISVTLNEVFIDYRDEDELEALNIIHGELEPGEEITGLYVFTFDLYDEEVFKLVLTDNWVTYARWIVPNDEIERE